jgi:3-hydroxyisobutyrate dehydrogenase
MTQTTTQALHIAFVGIGRMGAAMLKTVLDAGYHVTLYDPRVEATAPFVASHPELVRVAACPREAAAKSDVTSIVVNSNEQLLQACEAPDGVLAGSRPGSIVLVHSTVAREILLRLAAIAQERGVHLLDAMVSGAFGQASVGDLAVMVGGDAEAFERARPVMETYGSLVQHLGPQGAGLDAKLAINLLRYLCMLASQEAARLGEAAGVGTALTQLVAHTQSNRYTADIAKLVPYTLELRQKEAETSSKDLRAAIARGAELGLQLGSAEHALSLTPRLWGADTDPK